MIVPSSLLFLLLTPLDNLCLLLEFVLFLYQSLNFKFQIFDVHFSLVSLFFNVFQLLLPLLVNHAFLHNRVSSLTVLVPDIGEHAL